MLDTIVGGIASLHPWSGRLVKWIEMPAVHNPWYSNFFLHWTFLLEIAVSLWGAFIRFPCPAATRANFRSSRPDPRSLVTDH